MASSPITSWQIDGETMETVTDFIFLGSKLTADGDCSHEIKRHLLLGRQDMTNLDSILKSRNITLPTKVCLVKAMFFPVVVSDYKESWALKNRCFWTVVLEKTLESPLDCKEIQPVHSEGDQSFRKVFFGRTDAKAETPVLWPPHVKSWLIGKESDARRDRGQEEKGTTEDEMAGWHHQLDGHEFEWTPGVGDGQGGLACCNSWGRKQLDMTEQLNWTELSEKNTNVVIYLVTICNKTRRDKKYIVIITTTIFKCLLCGKNWGNCLPEIIYELETIMTIFGIKKQRLKDAVGICSR